MFYYVNCGSYNPLLKQFTYLKTQYYISVKWSLLLLTVRFDANLLAFSPCYLNMTWHGEYEISVPGSSTR